MASAVEHSEVRRVFNVYRRQAPRAIDGVKNGGS